MRIQRIGILSHPVSGIYLRKELSEFFLPRINHLQIILFDFSIFRIIISVSLKADFSDYLVTSRSISVYIMITRNNKKPVRRCSNGCTEIYQEPCRLVRKMIRLGICRPNIPCAENIITSNIIFLKILRQFFSHRICTHVVIIKMQIRYM